MNGLGDVIRSPIAAALAAALLCCLVAPQGIARERPVEKRPPGERRSPGPPAERVPGPAVLEAAIERARRYFATEVRRGDPSWISLFGYMRRRFGVEVQLATGEAAHQVRDGVRRPEIFEVFRRIDDPTATIDKRRIADLPHVVDRITASALHCDRIDLPPDWTEILEKASRAGGYALTHAVLATRWTVENGCLDADRVGPLQRRQVELLRSLIARRDQLAERFDTPTDLWIEAVVMAYYAGAGAEIPPGAVREIVDLQRADGGWPRDSSRPVSDPHTSALAMWALLENLRPARPVPWIAPSDDPGGQK